MKLVGGTLDFVKEKYGSQENKNKRKYAEFLQGYDLDEEAISAALVYDLGDVKEKEKEKEKEKKFDKDVLKLVKGLSRFNLLASKVGRKNKEDKIRKMLIASTEDLRVLVVKLLERLFEMRNLGIFNEVERKRISRDTMEIYAPMAYRLGLSDVKWELEDLAFRYLNPGKYFELKKLVGMERKERERIVGVLRGKLEKELKKKRIKGEIFGRPKHFYSIHKKMVSQNKKFEDVYDLLGLRVIVGDSTDCYKVLGIVNDLWDSIPGRFKDYIVSPKEEYQSLHTGFFYNKIPVEVQIRTSRMNDMAEEGIAAHWTYKGLKGEKKFNKQLSWLRQILDFGTESDKEFLYKLKLDLFEHKIFCFTPKGDIIELDEGSSIVDFAYGVHSEIGERCKGGRVNGKFVGLRHKLRNGDEVEILTSKVHKPSRDWLGFVRTHKALDKIKHSLSVRGMPAGRTRVLVEEKVSENFIGVEGEGKRGDYEVGIAKCCNPLPGEKIVGAVSSFKNVVVHSSGCENVSRIKNMNRVEAFWLEEFVSLVRINVVAEDRLGLFAEVLNSVAAMGIGVEGARAGNLSEDVVECILSINFTNLKALKKVVDRIKKIKGIRKIRIE